MFKITEVISKPIYTIYEGENVGTINNFLYDYKSQKIKGFFIFNDDSEKDFFVKKNKIFTLGQDYLLVKNKNSIKKSEIEGNNLINLQVVTLDGENLGEIIELFFDENYIVNSIETNKAIIIPAKSIINIGENIVIIDNSPKKINISRMKPIQRILDKDIPEIKVSILEESKLATIPIISKNFNENNFSNENKIMGNSIKETFKKTLILPPKILSNPKSIIGKYAKELLCGLNGEIIIKKGQMVTEKIYEKAQKHSKLFELTNNV